jgi:hypothetical protein
MTDGSHKTRRIGWPLYMQVYANACNQLATFSLYSFIVLLVIYFWLQFKMIEKLKMKISLLFRKI